MLIYDLIVTEKDDKKDETQIARSFRYLFTLLFFLQPVFSTRVNRLFVPNIFEGERKHIDLKRQKRVRMILIETFV